MLHNEARKLALEAWDKTHNAKEIAKYFSVNESTIYRLVEERARTGSYETRTQLRGRKPILTEKQHQGYSGTCAKTTGYHNEGDCRKSSFTCRQRSRQAFSDKTRLYL